MHLIWKSFFCLAMTAALIPSTPATAAYIVAGGAAVLTIEEGKANSIDTFNAYFNETVTRAQVLADAAPGNEPFTTLGPTTVQLSDPVRPFGVVPTPFPGTPGATRSPQMTTLSIADTSDVLGSWTASSDDFGGVFVGSTVLGEQIAFESMQRWTGPFPGSLLYGDFGLRYVPGRAVGSASGLVLTSNIDFLNVAWADLGNVSISVTDNQLSISGDLLIAGGLTLLDPSAVLGEEFGTFALTATLAPEPSTWGMLLGAAAIGLMRRRYTRKCS